MKESELSTSIFSKTEIIRGPRASRIIARKALVVQNSPKLSDRVVIRELREEEIEDAETIVRLAFGTFLQIPNPLDNPGDSQLVAHRWHRNHRDVIAAELDGKLVGTNVLTRWGSFAYFGPLTVRPELWDSGIASKLLEATMNVFDSWSVATSGLFTFANSPKHVGLYHKFGYYPRFLNAIMEKEIAPKSVADFASFSSLDPKEKLSCLEECQKLTSALYPGLDLSSEILLVDDYKLGDTLFLKEGPTISGFAICQNGPKTEAGKEKCELKFGTVKAGSGMEERFGNLLDEAQSFTNKQGVQKLDTGINLAHSAAFDVLLRKGFRVAFLGVDMQKPNEPAFDREGTYVLSDLR